MNRLCVIKMNFKSPSFHLLWLAVLVNCLLLSKVVLSEPSNSENDVLPMSGFGGLTALDSANSIENPAEFNRGLDLIK